jgi:hypothetical protein
MFNMVIGKQRKGDVTISTVILIILGLAVLVMLIVGFTKGWDTIFGPLDNAPSELQTVAKACEIYAKGALRIDFCTYRLVGNEIVNCRDERIIKSLQDAGIDTSLGSLRCDTLQEEKRDACKSLAPNKPETKINGPNGEKETCGAISASCQKVKADSTVDCTQGKDESSCKVIVGCTWR